MGMRVIAGGREIAYLSVTVTASMKDAVRKFTLQVSDRDRGLYPGTAIQIFAHSGHLLLDGFTNQYSCEFDDSSHTITVAGRSKAQDSADSSAEHDTGEFKNKTGQEIANELAGKVSNSYSTDIQLPKIPQYNINQGERIHQIALRLANDAGCCIIGGPGGEMRFTTAERASRGGMLGEGFFPVKSGRGELNDSTAHSSYEFRSQLAGREEKYGSEASEGVTKSSGSSTRYRPFVGHSDRSRDKAHTKNRADWKARQMEAHTKRCSFTIYGDDLQGIPVEPNQIVWCVSPWLGINGEMLIENCGWTTNASGTLTDVDLVAPEAYKGKSSSASKKAMTKADQTTPNANTTAASSDAAAAQAPQPAPSPFSGFVPGEIFVGPK